MGLHQDPKDLILTERPKCVPSVIPPVVSPVVSSVAQVLPRYPPTAARSQTPFEQSHLRRLDLEQAARETRQWHEGAQRGQGQLQTRSWKQGRPTRPCSSMFLSLFSSALFPVNPGGQGRQTRLVSFTFVSFVSLVSSGKPPNPARGRQSSNAVNQSVRFPAATNCSSKVSIFGLSHSRS